MFTEVAVKDGGTKRVMAFPPSEIEAMSIEDAAAYFERPAPVSADMAVRSFRARQRGERLLPASATGHAIHGDAIREALAKKRAES